MPHLPASSALQRFRVIDLSQVRAGPTACRQLADWGADVIQVQMPEHMRGDDTLGGQDGSDYQYTHRNKRSITLNLKESEGIETLKRLIAGADVVVENFRPDVKFRLGIDYETWPRTTPAWSTPASRASARPARSPSAPASTRSRRAWAG
jgi:crotonobetainyl-CoA:carnitine CoA-transferase CaiB-like acyl-CoA transferase